MKRIKKFLSLFLCGVLLAGANIVPVSADVPITETVLVEKYVSLFDLTSIATNITYTSGLPEGIDKIGVTAFNPNWAHRHGFNGVQSIVRNGDGSKSWRLDFTSSMGGGGWLNDFGNEFSVKFAVPTEYANIIKSISADITYASSKKLGYKFGVTDGTSASAFTASNKDDTYDAKYTSTDPESGSSLKITKSINSLYVIPASSSFKANSGMTDKWQVGDNVTYIYLTLVSRDCDGTEGGFALINDIGINVLVDKEIVVGTAAEERTYNLLDLKDHADGTFNSYPSGVSEFKADGNPQFSGNKSVYTKENGKKALKLDLSSTEFSYSNSNTDMLFGGGYNQIYSISLAVPSNHIPFISKIALKYDKQSANEILYNFGISDGVNFSKEGTNGNKVINSEVVGEGIAEYDPSTLNFASSHEAGADGGSDELWGDNEFTQIFLWVTAKPDNSGSVGDGYISFEEISYTILATDVELEAAKGYISGFENKNGTVTPYAAGGTKAHKYDTEKGKTTATVDLKSNPNISESVGLSFWINNPTSTNATFKICLKGKGATSYVVNDSYTVSANSYEKVNIDFSNIYRDKNYSNASGFTQGTAISLSATQIAALSSLTYMCRESNLTVYVDDFYFTFNESRDDIQIPLIGATGASEISADGSLKFNSSAEGSDITVKIPITDNAFKEGNKMTLNFDSDVTANYYVKMLGTNDDGAAAHWKWGYQRKSGDSLKAGVVGYTFTYDFAGINAKYNRGNIHEGTDASCWSCWPNVSEGVSSGHSNNPPTPSEKASVHTLEIRVFDNIGEEGEAVTLNSITVTNTPNIITAAAVENGTVSLEKATAYSGEIVGLHIEPNDGYYLKSLQLLCDNELTVTPMESGSGDNMGNYYTFQMPMSNVTVSPEFEKISETMIFDVEYSDKSDVIINFEMPLKKRNAYSSDSGTYKELKGFDVMFVAGEALEKYGIKAEELTYERVTEIIQSGHHLANYIYRLDEENSKKTVDGSDAVRLAVKITDISVEDRRTPLAVMNYADFEDDSVEDFFCVEYKTIDKYFYGDNLLETFEISRGINYDTALQSIGSTSVIHDRIFKLETWTDIKAHGFDHVRLPINLDNSTYADGKIMEEHLLKVDKAVDAILRAGMAVVIDLHGYKSLNTDFSTIRPEFLDVWDQLAVRYAHLPLAAAFQLINEPRFQDKTGPDLITRNRIMSIQEEAVDIIRTVKGNETRRLAISTQINMSSEMGNISEKILATDNLILDIHYYSPMTFSHSGNDDWDGIIGNGGYPAGATEFSDASNKNVMIKLDDFRKEHPNFIVWIGEWGAFNPNYEKKMEYYKSITGYAKDYNIAWAIWDYASGWGPYNTSTGWKADFLEAMGMSEFIT